jgi:hypothetical protein
MYIVRETFTARPGHASTLARMFQQVMAESGFKTRVLTDFIGPFNTVVLESEVSDLAEFERIMGEYAARQDVREKMKGYTEMYLTGGREVYRVV